MVRASARAHAPVIHASVIRTSARTHTSMIHATVIASIMAILTNTTATMSAHINMITVAARTMRTYTRTMGTYRRMVHFATSQSSVPNGTTVRIEPCMMVVTAMASTIGNPYTGTSIIEVVAIVVTIDGEIPTRSTPQNRTKEIVRSEEQVVLPVVQDAAQVI